MQAIDTIKALLHDYGLRVTTARVAILQVLEMEPGHRSMEDIYAAVLTHYPALDRVTIYRTLDTFVAHGLADPIMLGDKITRWERRRTAHHHLICRQCDHVVELDHAPFAAMATTVSRVYGVCVDTDHLALSGLCPACTQRAAARRALPSEDSP